MFLFPRSLVLKDFQKLFSLFPSCLITWFMIISFLPLHIWIGYLKRKIWLVFKRKDCIAYGYKVLYWFIIRTKCFFFFYPVLNFVKYLYRIRAHTSLYRVQSPIAASQTALRQTIVSLQVARQSEIFRQPASIDTLFSQQSHGRPSGLVLIGSI